MKVKSHKTAFGRHETFSLRFSWLPKGFHALQDNPKILMNDENATVTLGVGKNMVRSIRYWLRAARMTNDNDEAADLGTYLLHKKNGVDRYLEDEATIWLIHWLIASNSELATAWYWFFNAFHRAEFTSEDLTTSLKDHIRQDLGIKVAENTVKGDAALIIRMYAEPKRDARSHFDDTLDAPLSLLGLISRSSSGKHYHSRASERTSLPDNILAFALAETILGLKTASLPIEEMIYSDGTHPAPGAVFRLTENDFVAAIERICRKYPELFELRDTAGINQLYIIGRENLDPMLFLRDYYNFIQKVAA